MGGSGVMTVQLNTCCSTMSTGGDYPGEKKPAKAGCLLAAAVSQVVGGFSSMILDA
jgi:hypothetical protein